MKAYAVGLYDMRDRSWLPAYKEKVTALIAKHGGRYIARASNCPWMVLEGKRYPITGITIIEFHLWNTLKLGIATRNTRPSSYSVNPAPSLTLC